MNPVIIIDKYISKGKTIPIIRILFYYYFRLLNREGTLLAYSGYAGKDAKLTAAITSNIWMAYEKNACSAQNSEALKFIIIDCEVINRF